MKQISLFVTGFRGKQGKVTKREKFLSEMDQVIPWSRLIDVIKPHDPSAGNGRPPTGWPSSLSDLTKIPRRNRQAMRVMIFRTSVCTTTDSAHSDQSDAFKHLCDTLLGQKIYHCLVNSG